MLDFESKKRQILDRVDILALVSEHVAMKRSGKRWVGLCPFHAEKTPSFSVSPEMGIFKCFGCGKGGDIFSFVQLRENIPFVEALKLLADRAGVELDEPRKGTGRPADADTVSRFDIGRACAWAASFFRANLGLPSGGESLDYLSGRGFTRQTIEKFDIGLALDPGPSLREAAAKAGISPVVLEAADLIRRSEDGRYYETFRNRLMFPIRDPGGRIIGFGGRTLCNDKAKYLNTRQNALFDKGRSLFGIDLGRDSMIEKGRAVLVEGYTDCMACHQAGFPETVASLGTALTEAHVDLIRRYCGELILLFDSDQAGAEAADRALRVALPRSITVRLARVPEGKDPAEFLTGPDSASGFIDLLKSAVDALEFSWRKAWEQYSAPGSDARRAEAVSEFVRMVSEASHAEALDPIRTGLLMNQLAHLLRVERSEIARLLRSETPRRRGAPVPLPRSEPEIVQRDALHNAWVHVLEVLLNEPGLLGGLEVWPDPDGIANPRDRRIAQWVLECAREFGEFTLADVLARTREGDDAVRVAELAERGRERGNFEATLQAALQRLQQSGELARVDGARRRLLEKSESGDDEWAAFADGVRRHRHFGPLRLVRQAATQPPERTTASTELNERNSESI